MSDVPSEDLFLIRHGESTANVDRLVCGQMDCELTLKGTNQAQALQNYFHSRGILAPGLLVSPLKRAVQTAQLAFPEQSFLLDPDLKETSTGSASEWTFDILHAREPRFIKHGANLNLRYPDGESLQEMIDRVLRAFQRLVMQREAQIKVMVAHSGTINVILHHLLEIPWALYPGFALPNGSVTHLRNFPTESRFEIMSVGERAFS